MILCQKELSLSMWDWRRAPIAWLAFEILFLISMSSVGSNEMMDPRYLKCAVKSINKLFGRWILWVSVEF